MKTAEQWAQALYLCPPDGFPSESRLRIARRIQADAFRHAADVADGFYELAINNPKSNVAVVIANNLRRFADNIEAK